MSSSALRELTPAERRLGFVALALVTRQDQLRKLGAVLRINNVDAVAIRAAMVAYDQARIAPALAIPSPPPGDQVLRGG